MSDKKMNRNGILYIATGEKYFREALSSLNSVRKYCPDIQVCIRTDQDVEVDDPHCAVEIIQSSNDGMGDKVTQLQDTPFESTLFLDTDTWVCENIIGLFELLERFELAVAFAPKMGVSDIYGIRCPDSFAELNTGVLLYRKCESVSKMYAAWKEKYDQIRANGIKAHDQPAFRHALYHSEVEFFVLPHEYNFRVNKVNAARAGRVYILHGRNIDLASLAKRINRSSGQRAYFPYLQKVFSPHLILGTTSDKWMQRMSRVIAGVLSFRGRRG